MMRLIGRPKRPSSSLRVDLTTVEEVLRAGPWPAGLGNAIETLTGPLTDPRAEREREDAEWAAARAEFAGAAARFVGLAEWWDSWCAAGGLKRSARSEATRVAEDIRGLPAVGFQLARSLAAVLEELPSSREPLAMLARRVLGDAHALDASRPLGRMVVAAVSFAFLPGPVSGSGDNRSPSAREAWAAAGVVQSNLASTVLCLGVPGSVPEEPERRRTQRQEETADDSIAGSAGGIGISGEEPRTHDALRNATTVSLEAMRRARMPILLTLDQVRSGGVRTLPPGEVVHVCENPTVVEVVAARWAGAHGDAHSMPVLVCTSGQASTAVIELLQRLVAAGAECRYHGDFDWAGLRIAQSVRARVPWTPWRFSAEDYLEALLRGVSDLKLSDAVAESSWDPALARAMTEHGIAIEEEAVADLLADDMLRRR